MENVRLIFKLQPIFDQENTNILLEVCSQSVGEESVDIIRLLVQQSNRSVINVSRTRRKMFALCVDKDGMQISGMVASSCRCKAFAAASYLIGLGSVSVMCWVLLSGHN